MGIVFFLGILCWGHNFFPLPLELPKFPPLLVCVILCRSGACVHAHDTHTYMLEMGDVEMLE